MSASRPAVRRALASNCRRLVTNGVFTSLTRRDRGTHRGRQLLDDAQDAFESSSTAARLRHPVSLDRARRSSSAAQRDPRHIVVHSGRCPARRVAGVVEARGWRSAAPGQGFELPGFEPYPRSASCRRQHAFRASARMPRSQGRRGRAALGVTERPTAKRCARALACRRCAPGRRGARPTEVPRRGRSSWLALGRDSWRSFVGDVITRPTRPRVLNVCCCCSPSTATSRLARCRAPRRVVLPGASISTRAMDERGLGMD